MTSELTETLEKSQGQALVRLARKTLAEALRIPWGMTSDEMPLEAAFLDRRRATFVTLTRHGHLRGCIGTLKPVATLGESIRENTYSAAFNDHRFNPVEPCEFDEIRIEVSLLTEPKPLSFDSPETLAGSLRKGVDGVLIKKGGTSATFLPQVWGQIPSPEAFLSQLCLKAGLSKTAWRTEGLDVFTYQVQHFEEP